MYIKMFNCVTSVHEANKEKKDGDKQNHKR